MSIACAHWGFLIVRSRSSWGTRGSDRDSESFYIGTGTTLSKGRRGRLLRERERGGRGRACAVRVHPELATELTFLWSRGEFGGNARFSAVTLTMTSLKLFVLVRISFAFVLLRERSFRRGEM